MYCTFYCCLVSRLILVSANEWLISSLNLIPAYFSFLEMNVVERVFFVIVLWCYCTKELDAWHCAWLQCSSLAVSLYSQSWYCGVLQTLGYQRYVITGTGSEYWSICVAVNCQRWRASCRSMVRWWVAPWVFRVTISRWLAFMASTSVLNLGHFSPWMNRTYALQRKLPT